MNHVIYIRLDEEDAYLEKRIKRLASKNDRSLNKQIIHMLKNSLKITEKTV